MEQKDVNHLTDRLYLNHPNKHWYYCPECGFPNDLGNGCCSECGKEFDERGELQ